MVSFHSVGKLTVEFCGDQCWKWFRKREWMTELDDPKFQDSENTNTKTLQNNITKMSKRAIKWLKKFNSDKCKVKHVVVRITFPMVVHFHWIEIGYYFWGGGYWSYHRYLCENAILLFCVLRKKTVCSYLNQLFYCILHKASWCI